MDEAEGNLPMDEVQANLLEGAIGWLVQTILAALMTDKLDAWIRHLGLAYDAEKLRSEVERAGTAAAGVKGRAVANKPLARSLGRLRELLYDADEAVDELDYYMLQHQVQGGGVTCQEPEDMDGDGGDGPTDNADVPEQSNRRKKRSKAWDHFTPVERTADGKASKARCKYCEEDIGCKSKDGTSGMLNHLKKCKKNPLASDHPTNQPSSGDGAPNSNSVAADNSVHKKRKRTNEELTTQVAANPQNKAYFSTRIKQITCHIQEAVTEVLRKHASDSFAISSQYRSTTSDSHLMTSSLVQTKFYGRVAEKNSVMKLMTEGSSDGVAVVPIVGIGGIGKTALARHIYNNPIVKHQFQKRIWVCVSNNFDEVRLTKEMLDFVCKGKHKGLFSFAKLQESLMTSIKSKRFLLILDDVWDNMHIFQWNKLLAPFKSNNAIGSMILVTTRSLSVAKRIATMEAIKLGALGEKDFLSLFISCAFGNEKYEAHGCLSTIAPKIVDKLKGNPLAAETAGELLRKHHTVDHWNNILKNEDWKSLQLSGGIMPSLKLSYDQLSSHLQRCFLYCSIFPSDYRFVAEELVRIWISQGFVRCSHSNKSLEEIGQEYLSDFVNLGFFELVESYRTCYVMCAFMHDFAIMVSRTEYATIDSLQCNKMAPTVRHLSIRIDFSYHGDFAEKFEKIIKINGVPLARNLRTLVLIMDYPSVLLQSFKEIIQKAQNLRLLQISYVESFLCNLVNPTHVESFLCNLVNPTHIRYIKLEHGWHQPLSKFYHLQVLDASKYGFTVTDGVDDLVSLRHLVPAEWSSSITSIGKMTSLQKLHDFRVQNSSGFKIAELQSMNQLVQLGVSQLQNITTRAEACDARLRDKQKLETLRFSSEDTCDNAREVLEGLEPHQNLKHLHISRYNGCTSPSWLATSVTSLQTLCLMDCGHWEKLPSLESLPFLRKLELTRMRSTVEISIPSLEELVLIDMPKLININSCNFVTKLNDNLRVLKFKRCPVLKVFPLFGNCQEFEIKQTSWLPCLIMLTIRNCPHLCVHYPLPPSTIDSTSHLPSLERLNVEKCGIKEQWLSVMLQHMQALQELRLEDCEQIKGLSIQKEENSQPNHMSLGSTRDGILQIPSNLISSLKKLSMVWRSGFNIFASLEKVEIGAYPAEYLSLVHNDRNDDQANERWLLPLSHGKCEIRCDDSIETLLACFLEKPIRLKKLEVSSNSVKSLQLQSCIALEELTIQSCKSLAALEGWESLSDLKDLTVYDCPSLPTLLERLSQQVQELWPRLERLEIDDASILTTSFCKHLTSLQRLELFHCRNEVEELTDGQDSALQLLTYLQELQFRICDFVDLPAWLHSLPSLKRLEITSCSRIESLPEKGLPPSLKELDISYCSRELANQCRALKSELKVTITG